MPTASTEKAQIDKRIDLQPRSFPKTPQCTYHLEDLQIKLWSDALCIQCMHSNFLNKGILSFN